MQQQKTPKTGISNIQTKDGCCFWMFFFNAWLFVAGGHQGPVLSRKHFNADSLVERIDQQKRPVDVFRRELKRGLVGILWDSYGSGMGIVWETYHKGVPFLGVP